MEARQVRGTFAALSVRNFRRYVSGQALSLIGTWVETVAQALLVLRLTHSGVVLGLTTAARFAPVLLLSPYAGLLVDRFPKRRVLLITQTGLGLVSLALGILVLSGHAGLGQVVVLALLFGTFSAADNPARQAFVAEVVGRDLIRNAVTLNSTAVNVARVIGPAIAAVLVSTVGLGWCFIGNAASFCFVIASLLLLDGRQLHPVPPVPRAAGQLRAGLRYAARIPAIARPLRWPRASARSCSTRSSSPSTSPAPAPPMSPPHRKGPDVQSLTGEQATAGQQELAGKAALIASVGGQRGWADWANPDHRLRRLLSEFTGMAGLTFVLSGGAAILARYGGRGLQPWQTVLVLSAVSALWLVVAVYFLGDISAHFNPATTLAFALRRDMGWVMAGAYWIVQFAAGICGSLLARAFFGPAGRLAATMPKPGQSWQAAGFEAIITFGLVLMILNMANGPKLNGPFVPLAVGAYIMAWGTMGGPFEGASMNPARSLGPDVAIGNLSTWWVYLTGPVAGAVIAVAVAYVLRGPAKAQEARAAQGTPLNRATT